MALEFLKKGLFKKNKNVKKNDVSNDKPTENDTTEVLQQEITDVQPTRSVSKDDIAKIIMDNMEISPNTPLKLLWNIFYQDTNKIFNPMEYAFEPLIQTNLKINEIIDGNGKYIEYDENQADFAGFVKHVQVSALKLIKELVQTSGGGNIDKFINDMDIAQFESVLDEYGSYRSFDEYKNFVGGKSSASGKTAEDARPFIHVSKNKMHAWLMVIPPVNGGADINAEDIENLLNENTVVSGVNKSLITEICKDKKYFAFFEIAKGEYAVNGKDGYIVDKFPRHNNINIREDEKGNLNYKELNNVRSVHHGEIICEVYYPVEGTDGKRIDGKVVAAVKGKQPKIPNGKNVVFNEDKSLLIAEKDGELLFKDNVFMINELLTIENDVDNASGNIDFAGNVLIKGDVREGFSVKAEGNITIQGTAEGATLEANGDINITHGMNGGGKGIIRAEGNIKCIFLENCNAYAKGTITVDQVMYSEISSGDSITISGKKGSVTGGKIIAAKSITANVIGAANNSYLKTDIVLGCSPEMIKQQLTLNHNLKEVSDKLFKVNQDIKYIEDNIDHMPEDRIKKLDQLKVQQNFMSMQKENLEKKLDVLTKEMEETTKACKFKCKTLNPIINFKVGENTYTLNKQLMECSLFRKDNVVVLCSTSLVENILF